MAVEQIHITQDVYDKLGERSLREIARWLWPVDCQTCGRFLGDDPPSLCVDDLMIFSTATLHHQVCRASGWNDSGRLDHTPEAHLSFITGLVMMPTTADGSDHIPMVLLNPSLELVTLERDAQERWQPRLNLAYRNAGLAPLAADGTVGTPIPGAFARVTEDSLAVSMKSAPFNSYEVPATPQALDAARRHNGVLFAVTQTLHPGEITPESLGRAMQAGEVLVGRVALHGSDAHDAPASASAPVRYPLREGETATFALQWDDRCAMVGKLMGRKARPMTDRKARLWAARVIEITARKAGLPCSLIDWSLLHDEEPGEGWFTMDALQANMFLLRRTTDGWRLVHVYSRRGGGPEFESENEAKAWAFGVLGHQAGIRGLTWKPGPSTPRSSTLYATV